MNLSTSTLLAASALVCSSVAVAQQRFGPWESCPPGSTDRTFLPDLDGDGVGDRVVCDGGGLGIEYGLGMGFFEPTVPVSTLPGTCASVLWGDIDGDGDRDLVSRRGLSSPAGPTVFAIVVNLNKGGRLFGSDSVVDLSSDRALRGLFDLDGDGMDDLLLGRSAPGGPTTLMSRRAGGFGFFEPSADLFQLPFEPSALDAADLDRDGDLDLFGARGSAAAGQVWAAFQGAGGGFDVAIEDLPARVLDVEPIDHDVDGLADLLVSVEGIFVPSAIYVVRQEAPGALGNASSLGVSEASFAGVLVVADFDLDGVDDWARLGGSESFLGLAMQPPAYVVWPIPPVLTASGHEPVVAQDVNGDGLPDLVREATGECSINRLGDLSIGDSYCSGGIPNSAGFSALLLAFGDVRASLNRVRLEVLGLPPDVFGFFLVSTSAGDVFPVPQSTGRLCLGGSIGRFIAPGQVQNSGPMGRFELPISIFGLPSPAGGFSGAGDSLFFQAWHRDEGSFGPSNFTAALRIEFE